MNVVPSCICVAKIVAINNHYNLLCIFCKLEMLFFVCVFGFINR